MKKAGISVEHGGTEEAPSRPEVDRVMPGQPIPRRQWREDSIAPICSPPLRVVGAGGPATLILTFPGHPPSPNGLRGHWALRHKSTAPWRRDGWARARRMMKDFPDIYPWPGANIRVVWQGPRIWDADNMIAAAKPILDGIVQAGLLSSDRADRLMWLTPSQIVAKPRQVTLILERWEPVEVKPNPRDGERPTPPPYVGPLVRA